MTARRRRRCPGAVAGTNLGACPRCGSPTQTGFAFCQQCGFRLGGSGANIDAHGATLAAPSGAVAAALGSLAPGGATGAGAMPPMRPGAPAAAPAAGLAPTPAAGGTWGAAVSVNRDGSDGDRFPLGGEFVVIGRHGADVSFEQDRFLARQHARIEPTTDGAARVVPIDTLNGVFRKIDGAVELVDGATVLVGREVLRFERVDVEEKSPTPLIRHGVALFGSPPREPWGRLLQLIPSGGVRDVRHLWDDEVVLGREDGDLVFSDDQFLSRRHAAISWDGAHASLKDLGSSNGSFIRLEAPTTIKHGDHLRMGDQLFRIELRR
ncbi:MAG: FHA domain-containing protein [Kofleriaceae bacterium]|nr:FHA domain-containing protein [Kofleriaceae bacterium]